jgi:hypothetical protein
MNENRVGLFCYSLSIEKYRASSVANQIAAFAIVPLVYYDYSILFIVNRACLKFRYFMPGSTGLLMVKIKRSSQNPKQIWEAHGEQHDHWRRQRITLKSSVKFQVCLYHNDWVLLSS